MTDDRDPEPDGVDADPWAPGGAMSTAPIPPPPAFFAPAPPAAAAPAASSPADADVGARSGDGRPGGEPPNGGEPIADLSPPFPWVALVLAAVAALIAGGIWVLVRDDRGDPTAGPASTVPLVDPPATTSTVPSTTTSEPSPPTTDGGALDGASGGTGIATSVDAIIALPAALESLAPTEIVVLSGGGQVLQLDTSTGSLHTVLSRVPFDGRRLSATDNAILVSSEGNRPFVVAPRFAKPVLLDLNTAIGGVIPEADDEFLLQPEITSDEPLELTLDPAVRAETYDFALGGPWSAMPHPSGDLMVPGSDGVFLLTDTGPQQITTGDVVAIGRHHVLFRECGGLSPPCRLVLDDVVNGVQTELAGEVTALLGLGRPLDALSPDGGALATIAFDASGPMIRIVELATASAIDIPTDPSDLPAELLWAPDSSGVFGLANGTVVFRARATGEAVELTALADLVDAAGGVRSIAVRPAGPPAPGDPALALELAGPTGLRLIGLTTGYDIVDIDVDRDAFSTREGLPIQSSAPVFLYPDSSGVSVVSWDLVPGFRLDDDGSEPYPIDPDDGIGQAFPGPFPETRWVNRSESFGSEVAFVLVDLAGTDLGQSIEIDDAYPLGGDGAGGILVMATGGIYVASPDGARRVTTGELIASGPTAVVARECDEVLTCTVVRIDRLTGERQPVDQPTLIGAAGFQSAELTGQTVSPDGAIVLAQTSDNGLSWAFVDMAGGTELAVPGPASGAPVVWSADSRFAVFLSGDRLRIYVRDENRLVTITELPPLRTFAAAFPAQG